MHVFELFACGNVYIDPANTTDQLSNKTNNIYKFLEFLFFIITLSVQASTSELEPPRVQFMQTTLSGPIGGLICEVLLYFNWSHRWSQL